MSRPKRGQMLHMKRFGEKLRTLRQQQGLTLRELAPMLGINSYSYLSDIENGNKKPSLEFVLKIAELFDASLDQLLKDDLELAFNKEPND